MVIEQMAPVRLLARDFLFAQRIVAARSIDVDDIATAGVLDHGPIAVERVLADRRELEVAELASRVRGFADDAIGAPCRAGKKQSDSSKKQDSAESLHMLHGRFLSMSGHSQDSPHLYYG